jgi:hypothetical protein
VNLYLISQSENNDYDTYDSAVVAAESKEDAVLVNPGTGNYAWDGEGWIFIREDGTTCQMGDDWTPPKNVTAELIGVANEGTGRGSICSSFNAG